jgi:hypothetical protein
MEISLLIFVLFWMIVFGFIIWLVVKLSRQNKTGVGRRNDPQDIALGRYTRGDKE